MKLMIYHNLHRRFPRRFGAILALALMASLAISINAQSFTAAISGAVTDQAGAAISGATVTLKAVATGRTRAATTDNAGVYNFPNLPPGEYQIRITAHGFTSREITAQLAVSQALRADAQLSVGSTNETVNISAGGDGVAVETRNAQLSNVVNQRQVAELPLITRNPYDLVSLSAGA